MENNEQKKTIDPIFVEPEMVEDIPLSRLEQVKESARNIRRRMRRTRFPQIGMILTAAAAVIVLLALIAAPVLPGVALAVMLIRCCRSAFRAQTA